MSGLVVHCDEDTDDRRYVWGDDWHKAKTQAERYVLQRQTSVVADPG